MGVALDSLFLYQPPTPKVQASSGPTLGMAGVMQGAAQNPVVDDISPA